MPSLFVRSLAPVGLALLSACAARPRSHEVELAGTGELSLLGSSIAALRGAGEIKARFVAVGAPWARVSGQDRCGAAWVVRADDGSFVSRLTGRAAGWEFGDGLLAIPDLDGDGIEELVVAAPHATNEEGLETGAVFAYGSRNWTSIWEAWGPPPRAALDTTFESGFGTSLCRVSDVTGDGIPDIAGGAPGVFFSVRKSGAVFIVSGRDGRAVRTMENRGEREFGVALAFHQPKGTGPGTLFVGAPWSNAGAGAVVAFDPATGERRWKRVPRVRARSYLYDDSDPPSWRFRPGLSGLGTQVTACAGQVFAAVIDQKSEDTVVRAMMVLDSTTGEELRRFACANRSMNGATCIQSRDGGEVVLAVASGQTEPGHERGYVRVWDTPGGRRVSISGVDGVGFPIAGVGDLDGDGVEDTAVGYPWMRDDAGSKVGGWS